MGDGTASPSAGTIRIESVATCPTTGNSCLRLHSSGGVGDSISRSVNLAGTFGAMRSFDYRMVTGATAGSFVLEASTDGSNWTPLGQFAGAG